ncbi:MAG: ATP-binding protein [Ignavibacteriaceae bacterium]|jgi:predicted HTH transcriptional regulator
MENQAFADLILHGREERNLEYKGDINWDDGQIRAKLTKTILGMSNIRDGGTIVIGVQEKNEIFEPIGISDTNFETFKQDDISSFVNEYADPFVEVSLNRVELKDKKYVVIQIEEFSELPVICKKDGAQGLFRGEIYTRPRRKNETVKVPSQVEMREIVDMAVEKSNLLLSKRLHKSGIEVNTTQENSIVSFDKQLENL